LFTNWHINDNQLYIYSVVQGLSLQKCPQEISSVEEARSNVTGQKGGLLEQLLKALSVLSVAALELPHVLP